MNWPLILGYGTIALATWFWSWYIIWEVGQRASGVLAPVVADTAPGAFSDLDKQCDQPGLKDD